SSINCCAAVIWLCSFIGRCLSDTPPCNSGFRAQRRLGYRPAFQRFRAQGRLARWLRQCEIVLYARTMQPSDYKHFYLAGGIGGPRWACEDVKPAPNVRYWELVCPQPDIPKAHT